MGPAGVRASPYTTKTDAGPACGACLPIDDEDAVSSKQGRRGQRDENRFLRSAALLSLERRWARRARAALGVGAGAGEGARGVQDRVQPAKGEVSRATDPRLPWHGARRPGRGTAGRLRRVRRTSRIRSIARPWSAPTNRPLQQTSTAGGAAVTLMPMRPEHSPPMLRTVQDKVDIVRTRA